MKYWRAYYLFIGCLAGMSAVFSYGDWKLYYFILCPLLLALVLLGMKIEGEGD